MTLGRPKKRPKLPVVEELDFAYLLALMRPIHDVDGYALLPELFAVLGHEKLITLSRYFGGETFTIPTLDEISDSIDAIRAFYDVYIRKAAEPESIPVHLAPTVAEIKRVYDARDRAEGSVEPKAVGPAFIKSENG